MGRIRRRHRIRMYWFTFTSKKAAEKHLTAGAKRVVISAPGGKRCTNNRFTTYQNHEKH